MAQGAIRYHQIAWEDSTVPGDALPGKRQREKKTKMLTAHDRSLEKWFVARRPRAIEVVKCCRSGAVV